MVNFRLIEMLPYGTGSESLYFHIIEENIGLLVHMQIILLKKSHQIQELEFYNRTLIESECISDTNFTACKYKMYWTWAKCSFVFHQHYST